MKIISCRAGSKHCKHKKKNAIDIRPDAITMNISNFKTFEKLG